MPHHYDRDLMKSGDAARSLIKQGEDPYQMLLAAVWPDGDWSEKALRVQLTPCPECSPGVVDCRECGNTRLVTTERYKLLTVERIAAYAFEAA